MLIILDLIPFTPVVCHIARCLGHLFPSLEWFLLLAADVSVDIYFCSDSKNDCEVSSV